MMTPAPAVLILGPTAGGKTRLSIDLAQQLTGGGECVGADSMQIYRSMDIGTAKPTACEQAAARHHLIDIVEPDDDTFNVDTWLRLVDPLLQEINGRGHLPIIVGGTNLYIQAFLQGMFDGPPPDDAFRKSLEAFESEVLLERLQVVDPQAAERIHRNDRKRLVRALEVHHSTGTPISELQRQWSEGPPRENVFIVGLDYPAPLINTRINERVQIMVEAGLVEEVRGLLANDAMGVQAREALGYKQMIDAVEGRCSVHDAIEQIKIRTRRYAKQQRTWLRRFRVMKPSCWISAAELEPQDVSEQALTAVSQWVHSRG